MWPLMNILMFASCSVEIPENEIVWILNRDMKSVG